MQLWDSLRWIVKEKLTQLRSAELNPAESARCRLHLWQPDTGHLNGLGGFVNWSDLCWLSPSNVKTRNDGHCSNPPERMRVQALWDPLASVWSVCAL